MIDDSAVDREVEFIFYVSGSDKLDALFSINNLFGGVYLSYDHAKSQVNDGENIYSVSVFVNHDSMEIVNEL
jgi:hypothetical protein